MAAPHRRWVLGFCLLLTVASGSGCNVLSLPFFLFGPEDKKEAACKNLVAPDRDKPAKIVIWTTHTGLETRPEFLRADRELSGMLAQQLEAAALHNKEKITVVPSRQVEKFKEENPGSKDIDPQEIGAKFEADFVLYLEIDSISLYEHGSGNQLYRGKAEITVSVTDMNKPEDEPVKKPFSCQYPSESKGPVPVGDTNPQEFRHNFMNYVAKRLSWYFLSHPTEDEQRSND